MTDFNFKPNPGLSGREGQELIQYSLDVNLCEMNLDRGNVLTNIIVWADYFLYFNITSSASKYIHTNKLHLIIRSQTFHILVWWKIWSHMSSN